MSQSVSGARTGLFSRACVPALVVCALFGARDAHAAMPLHDACDLVASPHADALVDVPFEVVDGRLYVDAQVDGAGPFRFAVDTGASGVARADARLVDALGLPR